MENADHLNYRGCARLVENDVAPFGKFPVARHDFIALFSDGRVFPQRVKGIVKFLDVDVALRNTPLILGIES